MRTKITLKATAIILSSLFVTTNAVAQESASKILFEGWSGKASLGATTSSGSAETSNINGSIRLGKTVNKWEHIVFGSLFKGESAIVVEQRDDAGDVITDADGQPQREIVRGSNSDRLALGYQPRYYWKERTYLFGMLDWERDKPAGINTATRQIIGVGHKFYENDSGYFSGEIGFGNKTTDPTSGEDINGGIGYLGLNYLNRITETVSFNADMRSDFGSDNTFIELGLGLAFKVSDKVSFGITHFTRGNSDITDGDNPLASDNDSITTFNLLVDI